MLGKQSPTYGNSNTEKVASLIWQIMLQSSSSYLRYPKGVSGLWSFRRVLCPESRAESMSRSCCRVVGKSRAYSAGAPLQSSAAPGKCRRGCGLHWCVTGSSSADINAGNTFGNWDACKEPGSSGTGGAEMRIDQGPHGGAKEQLSRAWGWKMRIFCFHSTETGRRKGEPWQYVFSALPFFVSLPWVCVCPECISTMGTLEEIWGMKRWCAHSTILLICQQ